MTATPIRAADTELAGDAATGDVGAYASLYHRHIEAGWRLAQATAASGEAAAKATTNAFVGVISLAGRGREDVADQFRLHLLAAVYREAHRGSDQPAPTKATGKSGKGKAVAPGAAGPLLVSAFAHLPSRWRAALWLQEVERLPATEAGPILGISSAAAVQLKKRALIGLEHRVLDAGGNLPLPDLAPTLAATVGPVPSQVQARTEARWKKAVGRERRRATPVAAWMAQRAPGPLAVCVLGLCAVGVIGLAVVGQGTTPTRLVPVGPVASGIPAGGAPGGAPEAGNGVFRFTNPANPNPAAAGGGASTAGQGTHLVATTPTSAPPIVVTVPTTVPLVVPTVTTPPPVTIPPVTIPPVTIPPVTIPPVTLPPVPLPPVTTPPVPTPQAAATPVLQVGLNTGVLGVNVGVGPGACSGVQLLNIKLGCTGGSSGLSLGGTLLGRK